MLESVKIISGILDEEIEKLDGQSQNIYLGGFSQGCSLALSTFLTYPTHQLGGVLGLSGMLALDVKDWEKEIDLELKRKSKIFLYHGSADPMISCDGSVMTYGLLDKHNIKYSLTIEEGLEHSLSMKEIEKISGFFRGNMV